MQQPIESSLDDVLRWRIRALTAKTLLAASALFDRPFPLISEISLDEAENQESDQMHDDERSDADTECE
jgi:hypothetical protein